MRKIIFRGKSTMDAEEMDEIGLKHTNGWVHGNLVMYGNQPFIVGDFIEVEEEYTINEWWCPVHADSLGQFTGLKDKNGAEIYEGDIISVIHFTVENIPSYTAIVEWDKARFAERKINNDDGMVFPHITPHGIIGPFNTLSTFGKQAEIIGNIHEHKYSLEGNVMEQLTIKQLLDLGARIDIRFHDCESKKEAETKVNSLGYDGELEYREYLPDSTSRGFTTLGSVETYPVNIIAFYDYVEKLK